MKRIFSIILGLFVFLSLSACDKVPAGHVGIKVYLLGGEKGVDSEQLGVGRYWIGWNEELYLFPTFMQNFEWTADSRDTSPNDDSFSFQTIDGMVASADIGISYTLQADKIPQIFQTYRRGVDEITHTFLRNMVRDALVRQSSSKPIEYIYGSGKAELIESVQQIVSQQVHPLGITIEKIYWIGEIRVPEQVKNSIDSKLIAVQLTQQRRNEIEQVKAEAEKKVAEAEGQAKAIREVAEAQAAANDLINRSLTDQLIQYYSVEKWDGKLPQTMLPNTAVPMISLQQQGN